MRALFRYQFKTKVNIKTEYKLEEFSVNNIKGQFLPKNLSHAKTNANPSKNMEENLKKTKRSDVGE